MKRIAGIWLPDEDIHFAESLPHEPKVDGAATYQLSKINACLKTVERRRCALDVGAHVGLWSRILAKEFEEVIAFEPVKELSDCFARNLKDVENVDLCKFALGSYYGKWEMVYTPINSGNSHVAPNSTEGTTDIVQMDQFCATNIDFIKIDTEGYELEVLKGARKTIDRCRPVILIEQKVGNAVKFGAKRFDACKYLEKMGMHVEWVKAGDYCLTF
jgi:FkbM family methyltransferase